MSPETVDHLRRAVDDPEIVRRYWSHVKKSGTTGECWLWTGAISGKGHGRFSLGDSYVAGVDGKRHRRTVVVIAHRFGYALATGVDALLAVPLISHRCDNPLCQLPEHWRASNHRANTREYAWRRDVVRGALADTRGARGRSREIRDAARAGADVTAAVLAGQRPVHREQQELFPLDRDQGPA